MIIESFLVKSALDRGNAHPGSLRDDFLRLGLRFWNTMAVEYSQAEEWRHDLEMLNRARNAIAHAMDRRLVVLAAEGYPVVLRTVRRWHSTLDGLVECMDEMVGKSLAELLGAPAPW